MKTKQFFGVTALSVASMITPINVLPANSQVFNARAYNHDLDQAHLYCSQQSWNPAQYRVCIQPRVQHIEILRRQGFYHIPQLQPQPISPRKPNRPKYNATILMFPLQSADKRKVVV